VLQWLAFAGIDSSVLVTTSSTCLSVIERGAPGRGSSSKPSNRFTRNLSRHLQTVACVIFKRFATVPLLNPSSQPSTIRARIAMACPVLGRRANIASFSFSSDVTLSGLVGRPIPMPQYEGIASTIQRIYNS
jgi:hypothetical protein